MATANLHTFGTYDRHTREYLRRHADLMADTPQDYARAIAKGASAIYEKMPSWLKFCFLSFVIWLVVIATLFVTMPAIDVLMEMSAPDKTLIFNAVMVCIALVLGMALYSP